MAVAILLVNNYIHKAEEKIRRYKEVLEALSGTEVMVERFHKIRPGYKPEKPIEAVVLSGSEAYLSRPEDRAFFEGEIEFVRRIKVPLLGICFGHQLIGLAFGAEVIQGPERAEPKEVVVEVPDHIFASWEPGDKLFVAERHRDELAQLPPGFVRLATSGQCRIEAMGHLRRPIFGVQFHPERRPEAWMEEWDGLKVLANFIQLSRITSS